MNPMANDSIFLTGDGKQLSLTPVLNRLSTFIQHEGQSEAGGVLLGRVLKETGDIIIDEITVPTEGDQRSRFTFYRSRKKHQQAIDMAWEDSQKTCNYLGEWHTHPEPVPTPSSVDLRNWKARLKKDFFDGPCLYFIIVGTETIEAWEGCKESGNIVKLSPWSNPAS